MLKSLQTKTCVHLKQGNTYQAEYCGVCCTDLHVAHGTSVKFQAVFLDTKVGIDEVAPDVKSLKLGDRVSVAWLAEGCGTCEYCTTGRENSLPYCKNAGYSVDGEWLSNRYCRLPVKVPTEG